MSAPLPHEGIPMNKNVILIVVLIVAAVAVAVVLSNRNSGPMGKVGHEMDKAGESIKDAVTPDGPAEKAGKKVDDAVDAIKD
jgi:hypothetical protein